MKTVKMRASYKTKIIKDFAEKSILVSREFTAPVKTLWNSFTSSEVLDKWWGPLPWRAETKTIKFSPGGYWLYAMVGPENQRQWGRMKVDFKMVYPANFGEFFKKHAELTPLEFKKQSAGK